MTVGGPAVMPFEVRPHLVETANSASLGDRKDLVRVGDLRMLERQF